MLLKRSILFVFIFSAYLLQAQVPYTSGAGAAGLAGISLLPVDVWAVHNNPAALSELKEFRAGLWAERRYNLKELTNGAVAIAIPVAKAGVLGIGIYQYGTSTYFQQQKYSLCYGLKLSPHLYAGAGLHLLNTHITLYGNQLKAIGEIALLYKFSQHFEAAASIWNPTASRLAEYQEERIPADFRLALGYKISGQLHLLAEGEKLIYGSENATPGFPALSYKFGLQYQPDKKLDLLAGVRSNPGVEVNSFVYSFGLAYRYQRIKLSLAFALYEVIGSTPHAAMEYINNTEK